MTVLCTRATERPPLVRNHAASGRWRGVEYVYTPGDTRRAATFAARRWAEIKGSVAAIRWLWSHRRRGELDCVYLWTTVQRMTLWGTAFKLLLSAVRIPWALEVNELPWSFRTDRRLVEKLFSPLSGARGAICISAFLERWAVDRRGRRSPSLRLVRVPIVVDADELPGCPVRVDGPPRLILAASADYAGELQLVLDALEVVWREEPGCVLVITGWGEEDPRSVELRRRIAAVSRPANVVIAGNLPRDELLTAYGASTALLAPLVASLRSEARFPTKIGEYLASGSPVVTTRIGEPGRLLVDGLTAYVAEEPAPPAYGAAILRAIRAPEAAAAVGRGGRELALTEFDYRRWGESLEVFFATCAGLPVAEA